MNEELQAKLAAMADGIGVKAEALLNVLVQEQVRGGWIMLATMLSVTIIFALLGWRLSRAAEFGEGLSSGARDACVAGALLSIAISLSTLFACLATVPERICCPTKAALQGLLK